MEQRDAHNFTTYGWLVCLWVLVASFQYGWNISVLNQLQTVVSCAEDQANSTYMGLPLCIPGLTDTAFSMVTAAFSAGGLIGSAVSSIAMDRLGRKYAMMLGALSIGAGGLLMTVASTVGALLFGRLLVGVGAGIGISGGPVYVAEIAPAGIKGRVGVLTQMAIVLGIMLTQVFGLWLATPHQWRFVLFISAAISIAQLLLASSIVESPAFIRDPGKKLEVAKRLWGARSVPNAPDTEALLENEEIAIPREPSSDRSTMSIPLLFKTAELRKPLYIACSAMLAQQFSGINAVLYYSNNILSSTLPELGPYVSLGMTIVNVIMTFPPLFLIDKFGKRHLMHWSVGGLVGSLIIVGIAINAQLATLASIAIVVFVTSFAIGLGPVPFIIIPEISPSYAVSTLSSAALSFSWISNFLVASGFIPLKKLLSQGDSDKEGRVFYVFAALLAVVYLFFLRVYKSL